MNQTEKMRTFIIKFVYVAIWAGIIFCVLKYAMPLFMPFVVAFLISFFLKPLINRLAEKTPLGRKPAAIIVLILAYVVLGGAITLIGSRLVVQISTWLSNLPAFYASHIEPAINNVEHFLEGFSGNLDPKLLSFLEMASDSISNAVSNIVGAISQWAINFVTGMATSVPLFIVAFVLCIIASFFFVVDYYKITSFIMRQFSPENKRRLFVVRDFVVNVLLKFARAYLILLSLTFVEVSIGLLILRVENPFIIAFFTAIVDILPVFGTGTIMIPWALYSFFTGNYFLGAGLLILYAAITVIRQFLEPRVVGKQIGLYPLLTLICMFIGARLFGFWGMLGFPITLTVIIHLNRSGEIRLFRDSSTPGEGEPPAEEGSLVEGEDTGGESAAHSPKGEKKRRK